MSYCTWDMVQVQHCPQEKSRSVRQDGAFRNKCGRNPTTCLMDILEEMESKETLKWNQQEALKEPSHPLHITTLRLNMITLQETTRQLVVFEPRPRHSISWASQVSTIGRPTGEALWQQREPKDGCDWGGTRWRLLLRQKLESEQSRLFQDLKHLMPSVKVCLSASKV